MSKFFANFAFLLFVVGYANFTGPDRKMNIPDWYLDVAIMVDQSRSMTENQFREAYEDVTNWMDSLSLYAGNNTEPRFAVIYCCQLPSIGGIKHYLSQGNFKTAVRPLLTAATYDANCAVNWDGCMQRVTDVVFSEKLGSRENATKIAMFISGCEFLMAGTGGRPGYHAEAQRFRDKINKNNNGKLVFVCVWRGDMDYWDIIYTNRMDEVIEINGQIPSYEAYIWNRRGLNFSDSIDVILPRREADMFDCKTVIYCSENCMMNDPNTSSCHKVCNVTVIQMPRPRKYAKPCYQLNANDTECECLPEITTKTTKADIKTIVSVSVACVLVLLLLIMIIVAVVIERGRKKAMKQHHVPDDWTDYRQAQVMAKMKEPTQMRKSVRKPGPAIAPSSSVRVKSVSKTKKTTTKRGKSVPKQTMHAKSVSKAVKTKKTTVGGKGVLKQSVHGKSVSKAMKTKKTATIAGKKVYKQSVHGKSVSKALKTKKTATIGGKSVFKQSVQGKSVSKASKTKKTTTMGGKSVSKQSAHVSPSKMQSLKKSQNR